MSEVVGSIGANSAFADEVENILWDKDVTYMDAIILWCERMGVEVEHAASLIKKDAVLMSKLQTEAEDLRYIKRGARLPI